MNGLRLAGVLLLLLSRPAWPQAAPWVRLGANAIPLFTYADPVPRGDGLAEARVVQPTLMTHGGAFGNRLRLLATVNLEGLTIPNGELTMGDWGEGFMDRRHPHTYVHEVMLGWVQPIGRNGVSLAAGKGFAPFGTDDPMSRPIVRYPVNHHLAQILERAVAILGTRVGPVLLEGALFNGDEPEEPDQWPNFSRFGDSWSGRLSLFPLPGLELQGSYADVHSPEHRPGFGTDQSKWSLSGRWSGPVKGFPVYGLVEWAQTSEADGFFVFHSFLGEGAWTWGPGRLLYRFERTERPEEERTPNPFRSVRPHLENSILGTTRWTIHTLGSDYELPGLEPLRALPFLEISYGRIELVEGLVDPVAFYGKSSFWSVSLGVRFGVGLPLHRMGRYGMAQDTAQGDGNHQHGHDE